MTVKILVVDDEPDLEALIRQKFRQQIRQANIHFLFVHNGVEALETLQTEPDIDIVITDIKMPRMNGLTLLNKLQEVNPTIKTVIVSAYGDIDNIRTAMNRGAFDFLTKPIDLQDLEATTQKTLDNVHEVKLALQREQKVQQAQEQLLADLQQEVEDRAKAEQALRASEQQLAQFLEAVPAGIFVVNAQGQPYYANQTALQILGKDLLLDVNATQLPEVYQTYQIGSGKLYPTEKQPLVRALKGYSTTVTDMEIRRKGKRIPLEVSARPIVNDQGDIIYAIAAFQDITQRLEAEQERIRFAQTEAVLQKDKQKLLKLATLDSLTQVANRRRFDEYLDQEWHRLARELRPLSLIMTDVDCFKAYNDTYGHQAGDTCLKRIAQALQSAINRPADLVTRYGGEEFAVILPNTDMAGALNVAKAVQRHVQDLAMEHQGSTINQYVTLSIGIASVVPHRQQSASTFVKTADLALYQAKQQGKNRICSAPQDGGQTSRVSSQRQFREIQHYL